jgi:hypothetical protein
VEVYYEKLLKLATNLQHRTIDSFLTIAFIFGLQPYLHVATSSMKRETLQQHEEIALVCEKGIFEVEAINNLSIPHSSKTMLAHKPHTNTEKTRMYCINCHMTNHNVETYKVKKRKNLFL